jgi:CTP:molybdopterin cytidylyltransferase MocA
LTRDDLATLTDAYLAPPTAVLVPTFGGVRGNPILLARASLDEILARVLVDVDRPEDYAALL